MSRGENMQRPDYRDFEVEIGPGDGARYPVAVMCILVANPDHSVNLGTGNCVDLP